MEIVLKPDFQGPWEALKAKLDAHMPDLLLQGDFQPKGPTKLAMTIRFRLIKTGDESGRYTRISLGSELALIVTAKRYLYAARIKHGTGRVRELYRESDWDALGRQFVEEGLQQEARLAVQEENRLLVRKFGRDGKILARLAPGVPWLLFE